MKKKKKKSKKSRAGAAGDEVDSAGNESDVAAPVVDIVAEDMPEGALPSDDDDKLVDKNDPHRLLNFELEAMWVDSSSFTSNHKI